MKVLVAYATKHEATAEIALRIGDTLTGSGHDVSVCGVADVGDPVGYDGFVIGSAVYFGHWRDDAVKFVRRAASVLATRPVWLFSSGPLAPVDESATEDAAPTELAELLDLTHARDHRVFPGVLDPKELTLAEKVLRKLPAGRETLPTGDFRDWPDIDEWAKGIDRDLRAETPPAND